jgi:hypothetical protein
MVATLHILAVALFILFGSISFYHAFKSYKSEETFYENLSGSDFFLFTVMIEFFLWVSKKLFPNKMYILVYRMLAFLCGVLLFMLAAWLGKEFFI